jgi:hypothetical protein
MARLGINGNTVKPVFPNSRGCSWDGVKSLSHPGHPHVFGFWGGQECPRRKEEERMKSISYGMLIERNHPRNHDG